MKFLYRFSILIFLVGSSTFAARPLETADAGTVDPGCVEVELGAAFSSDSAEEAWETGFGIKTGLLPGLDVGLGFGWQRVSAGGRSDSGVTDTEIGVKWNVLSETNGRPAFSITVAVKLPTADDDKGLGSGKTDWDICFVVSKELSDSLTGHLNAGYTWVGTPSGVDVGDVIHGSAALELALSDSFCLTGEVLAEREREDGEDTLLAGLTGLRWAVSDALALDAAVGTALNGGDTPDLLATVGLTWIFGP